MKLRQLFNKKHYSLLAAAFMVSACGGENAQQLPADAVLSISPAEVTWTIVPNKIDGACIYNENLYQDHAFIATLTVDGAALGDINLRIFATLSGNTFSGLDVIKIYDDVNQNGVIDSQDRLVSAAGEPAYDTTFNQQGVHMFLARVNVSCGYRGTIDLFASSAYASATIEVVEEDVETE